MSTRERWIVYPLLFLTLGIVMRDKIVPRTRFQIDEVVAGQILCNQLQVKQVIAAAGIVGSIRCDDLAVIGSKGRPTVVIGNNAKTGGGSIQTLSRTGAPLVLLQPTDSGGVVVASEFIRTSEPHPKKPKTSATPSPKRPAKQPEKAPPKAGP
jgi:hypothetical protein